MKKRIVNFTAAVLALLMMLTLIPGFVFASQSAEETSAVFTNRSAALLRDDAGLSWKEWNDLALKNREEGLSRPVSMGDILTADPEAEFQNEGSSIYYVNGKLPVSITDVLGAYRAVYQLLPALLGRTDAELMLISEFQVYDHKIYMFQEVFEGRTILGSMIRLVTDHDGNVITVFSSLSQKAPVPEGRKTVDAAGAEESVRAYLEEQGLDASVLPEFTEQILVVQDSDAEDVEIIKGNDSIIHPEEFLPDLLQWVVYTDNSKTRYEGDTTFPYQAHYISADGKWLSSIEVKNPCDEASRLGNPDVYMFERMEDASWTGEVTSMNGTTRTITVPVMHDPDTGEYILGDVKRRILVGDFYNYVYNDQLLVMAASPDNTGWDEDDLLTFANFLTVWDYFNAMGWQGTNGLGTPTLILKDMCLENTEPMDNAAYCGNYYGWQMFAYDNSVNGFGEALDVMAHEYTHGVTNTLQGTNLYCNDAGAINESMSDIMGSICEMEVEKEDSNDWMIGEDTSNAIRSMLNPHQYNQPEYVWDIFYGPSTKRPNEINDYGGVHSNSSILNRLAAVLAEEGGMKAGDAWRFWICVLSGTTPTTDLAQIADVMEWALEISGNGEFRQFLKEQIDYGRLQESEIPDPLPEGQQVVTLQLPDTEVMQDPFWIMQALQLKKDSIMELLMGLGSMLFSEEDDTAETDVNMVEGLLNMYTSWPSDESGMITMVTDGLPSIFVLLNLDMETMEPQGAAILMGNKWIDLSSLFSETALKEGSGIDEIMESFLDSLLNSGVDIAEQLFNALLGSEEGSGNLVEGSNTILTNAGLENVQLITR